MGCLRRTGFAILSIFKTINVYWLWLWGYTPESASAKGLLGGQVWEEFCDSIKAGASMLAGDPPLDGFPEPGRGIPVALVPSFKGGFGKLFK